MTTYMLKTITTYIFEADTDEEAIDLTINDMDYIDGCVDSETLYTLETIYTDDNHIVKDYR